MVYVLDTSVMIEISQYYFPEVFPSFWETICELIIQGDIVSLKEVQEELKKDSKARKIWDEINKKCDNRLFIDLEEGEAECMPLIEELDIYTEKFRNKKKVFTTLEEEWGYGSTAADPLLICHGLFHGSTIVTLEKVNKGHNIPHVCYELGVESLNLKGFLVQVSEFNF